MGIASVERKFEVPEYTERRKGTRKQVKPFSLVSYGTMEQPLATHRSNSILPICGLNVYYVASSARHTSNKSKIYTRQQCIVTSFPHCAYGIYTYGYTCFRTRRACPFLYNPRTLPLVFSVTYEGVK